jgi:hypothetical protein
LESITQIGGKVMTLHLKEDKKKDKGKTERIGREKEKR